MSMFQSLSIQNFFGFLILVTIFANAMDE